MLVACGVARASSVPGNRLGEKELNSFLRWATAEPELAMDFDVVLSVDRMLVRTL